MKCRYCGKPIKNTKTTQKQLALCSKCYNFDKKRVVEGVKYSNAH